MKHPLAPILLLVVLATACAPRRVAPPAPRPELGRRPQSHPSPTVRPPAVAEPTTVPAAPEPPDILAAITPETPPHEASSLRLADQGRKRLLDGDVDGALDQLEQATKIDSSNPYAYYWIARAHYERRRYDQTIAFAEKAAVLFGESRPAWLSRTYTLEGTVFEELGRYADARDAYRRAVEAEPGNVAARAGLARLGAAPQPPSR